LIVQKSDRIMTRSRARQNPDQYTTVTAQLKIIKLLVEELLAASGNRPLDPSSAAAADLDDDDEEDDDWEDDPNDFVDLASGMSKSQLMSYAADDGASSSRGRDDDTEAYLLNWFQQTSQKPGFGDMFNALTEEEQEKLRNMNA
jgi:importin-9